MCVTLGFIGDPLILLDSGAAPLAALLMGETVFTLTLIAVPSLGFEDLLVFALFTAPMVSWSASFAWATATDWVSW